MAEAYPIMFTPILFTSFFSTKDSGQGIGLTMIRGILLSHGFQFKLKSGKAEHTTFGKRLFIEEAK